MGLTPSPLQKKPHHFLIIIHLCIIFCMSDNTKLMVFCFSLQFSDFLRASNVSSKIVDLPSHSYKTPIYFTNFKSNIVHEIAHQEEFDIIVCNARARGEILSVIVTYSYSTCDHTVKLLIINLAKFRVSCFCGLLKYI